MEKAQNRGPISEIQSWRDKEDEGHFRGWISGELGEYNNDWMIEKIGLYARAKNAGEIEVFWWFGIFAGCVVLWFHLEDASRSFYWVDFAGSALFGICLKNFWVEGEFSHYEEIRWARMNSMERILEKHPEFIHSDARAFVEELFSNEPRHFRSYRYN